MEDSLFDVLLLGKELMSITGSHLAKVWSIRSALHAKRYQFRHILHSYLYNVASGKHSEDYMDLV